MMLRIVYKKPKDLELGNMWIAKKYIIDQLILVNTQSLYLGGMMLSITTNIKNVSLTKGERKYGKSNYTLYKLIKLFLNGLIFSSITPLKIAYKLAAISAVSSFILAVLIILAKLIGIDSLIIYTLIICLILLIGSIQLIIFGVIGEHISRIYTYSSKSPKYIISERKYN